MCTPPAGCEEQYFEGASMVVSPHHKYKTDIFDVQQFFRGWTKTDGIKRRGLEAFESSPALIASDLAISKYFQYQNTSRIT